MSTAAQDLAEGLAALDSELGETYTRVLEAATFTARLERNRPCELPNYGGTIRETVLHVRQAQDAFADSLPEAGEMIARPGGEEARLARIDPGEFPGMLVFVLAGEFA